MCTNKLISQSHTRLSTVSPRGDTAASVSSLIPSPDLFVSARLSQNRARRCRRSCHVTDILSGSIVG
ncbi:hypothetical protein B0T21DRAFT_356983, partial [Apiosordaria backusii]